MEGAIEERLADGGRHAIELGRELTSIPRLLDEAARGLAPPIGALAERLLVRAVCESRTLEGRPPPPVSAAIALRAIFVALRRAGIGAAALRLTAPRLLGRPSHDVTWLVSLLERYESLLGSRIDDAGRTHQALRRLATAPLPSLREVGEIELHDAAPFDPLERAVIDALAARGLTVRAHVPDPPPLLVEGAGASYEDALGAALGKHLEALEAVGDAHVERRATQLGAGSVPEIARAATPLHEARVVAARVRDRIAAGAAPDEIAVVAEQPEVRAQLAIELGAYGVPVERVSRGALLEVGGARLVTAIYRLLADGMARDGLVDLLTSPHLAPTRDLAVARLAAVVRAAAPTTVDAAGLRAALSAWARSRTGPARVEAEAVLRHVSRAIELLSALPARAPMERHVAALAALLADLGVGVRALPPAPPAPGDALGRGLARERAASRMFEDLLVELPRAAARAGLADRGYERAELAALLGAELELASLPSGGGHGAAVLVCELAQLPEHAWALLVLAGLEEGALPARSEEDPLLSDETRHVVNRAFDRPVLPLSTHAELRARVRLARARAGAREVLLCSARADGDGRPRQPGELVEHARALGASEARPRWSPIATLASARTLDELHARYLLERDGDEAAREGLSSEVRADLRARLAARDEPRVVRAEALAGVEQTRAAFFAGEHEAGRHDGRVVRPDLLASLVARGLPGTSARPLSASTISRYVECPQRYFLEAVLRVRSDEPLSDELDERAAGSFAHLALDRLFRAWRDLGLFPLTGRPEEEAQLTLTLDDAVAAFLAEQPRGNELAFQSRVRALARVLRGVWRREIEEPVAPGLRPTHFELRFDELAVPGELAGEAPVYLRGAIDRVDLDGERAAVFDYKSGRLANLKRELKPEAWGESSWQLPIYAAVVRAQLGVRDVTMGYYSLKELAVAQTSAPPALSFTASDEGGLASMLWARVHAMREGRFDVAPQPQACERCRLQPACRIVERRDDEDDA